MDIMDYMGTGTIIVIAAFVLGFIVGWRAVLYWKKKGMFNNDIYEK